MEPQEYSSPMLSRRSFMMGSAGAVLGTLVLAGCSTSASATPSHPHNTTLRFYEQKTEVIPYFDNLLRQFEKGAPGIKVVHDQTSDIAPQFVRGEPDDVGCFNITPDLGRYITRGLLGDLSNLPSAKTVKPEISALTDQYGTYPGRTSALPYSLAAAGVIYNKTIFAKYHLPVPTTWNEFVDVCDALKKTDVIPIFATDLDTWTLWQGLFDYSVGSLVDTGKFFAKMKQIGTEVGPNSEVSFEKTLALPMERAKKISTYFNPDHAVRSYPDGNLAFGKGEAAMYLQGPWALGQIALVNKNLDIGTFPLPVSNNPADRQVRVNVDLGLYIPTATKHRPEAEQLVEFLMQPSVINKYNADNLAYSTLKGAPPQNDPRVAGLQTYVDHGAFYQGAGSFVPTSIPLGNYLQTAIRTGDFNAMLRQLDGDWRRLAERDAV